jgi:hypothetical protein
MEDGTPSTSPHRQHGVVWGPSRVEVFDARIQFWILFHQSVLSFAWSLEPFPPQMCFEKKNYCFRMGISFFPHR